jgi:hypothetical protein
MHQERHKSKDRQKLKVEFATKIVSLLVPRMFGLSKPISQVLYLRSVKYQVPYLSGARDCFFPSSRPPFQCSTRLRCSLSSGAGRCSGEGVRVMHDSVIETLYTLAGDLLSYVSRILARRNPRGLECRLAVYSKFIGRILCVDGVSSPVQSPVFKCGMSLARQSAFE